MIEGLTSSIELAGLTLHQADTRDSTTVRRHGKVSDARSRSRSFIKVEDILASRRNVDYPIGGGY